MQTEATQQSDIVTPAEVLHFWIDEAGPKGWYLSDPEFDDQIRTRFLATWQAAKACKLSGWTQTPRDTLALLIVLDQFPRNMFRGHGDSFATDAAARAVAKKAIEKRWDMRLPEPERQFFYLPLMHSECLVDQDRCVRLVLSRMPETGAGTLPHACAHRQVIRDFGRFPYRNAALDRNNREEESVYLDQGGYAHTVRQLQEKASA